jgi:methyl-accepting chemotaxis protein
MVMGTQKRSRLVVRILIAITLTVVVMNVLQTAIVTNRIDNIVSGNYEEECDELTRSYTDLISSKISEYMSLLTVYTSADIVKTGDPAQIVPWLKSHADIRNKAFDYVAFVDLEGNFDSDIDTHTTVVDRSYYQDIVKKGMETTMDNPVTSKVSGQTIVHICRAAKANGETIGFFTGIVSLDTLKSIIEHIKIGSTGFATLYSGDSQLIATSGDEETVKADFEFSKGNADYAAKMTSAVASGKPGSSWAPNSRGSQSYLSFASIDGTPGWTFLFCVDKVQVQAASRSVSKWNVGVGIVYGILLLVVMAVMVVSALKPLEVVQSTINGIASGNADLTQRIVLKNMTNNEIGGVVNGFNKFSEKLQDIIRNVKNSKDGLVVAGRNLNDSTEETSSSIAQIIATIETMGNNINNQSNSVTQTAGAVNEIASNIESLNHMIETQAASVTQASAAVEEMIENVDSVDKSVNKMALAFEDLEHKAVNGVQKQDDVNKLIKTVENESRTLQEANSVISSIAEQTNLLAMNAAIEAAHAGEAGKGFSVVADEIRKLSETSSQQSKTIGDQLKKISTTIEGIVQASLEAGKAFEAVSSGINDTNSLVQEIKTAMVEQGEGSKQISLALGNMNDSTSEVRTASLEMSEGNKAILQEIQLLQDATLSMRQGMDEMAVGAKKINETGTTLASLSEQLENSIASIGQQIDQFQV